jgi:hypothetical protein
MITATIIICVFMVFPYAFRILRKNSVYIIFLLLSLIYVLLEYYFVYSKIENLNENKKTDFIFSVIPLVCLISFKIIDLFFLKFKKRHIYFTERHFQLFSDGEAEKADWIDFTFQMLLIVIPFFSVYILAKII